MADSLLTTSILFSSCNKKITTAPTSGTTNLAITGKDIVATLTDGKINKTIKVSAHFKCT
jgi:hypothetical protein